ncbi:MAG: hypothetical protein PHH23_01240 [Paludibacteraceae bacterium]|jgi:hypothetical protein|nr:hypothetical protein [Paludibacteraceae bacterium]
MADNYLERQYADYEVKRAAWEKAKKLRVVKRKSTDSTKSTLNSTKSN